MRLGAGCFHSRQRLYGRFGHLDLHHLSGAQGGGMNADMRYPGGARKTPKTCRRARTRLRGAATTNQYTADNIWTELAKKLVRTPPPDISGRLHIRKEQIEPLTPRRHRTRSRTGPCWVSGSTGGPAKPPFTPPPPTKLIHICTPTGHVYLETSVAFKHSVPCSLCVLFVC